MNQEKINRINELYKKQKSVGLTVAEKEEQTALRKEYLGAIRKNFEATMETVKIKDEQGNIKQVKKKK